MGVTITIIILAAISGAGAFSSGNAIVNGPALNRIIYCGRPPLHRAPFHMNATKCGGYCHADTNVQDKFVINVWNQTTGENGTADTYWNGALYVTIKAIGDYVIKGFSVAAINDQGTVVGTFFAPSHFNLTTTNTTTTDADNADISNTNGTTANTTDSNTNGTTANTTDSNTNGTTADSTDSNNTTTTSSIDANLTEIVSYVCNKGHRAEGSTAIHYEAVPNRTSVTLKWVEPKQNYGPVKFRVWIVHSHDKIFYMESAPIHSLRNGTVTLDLPSVFKKLLRSASSKFGSDPLDVFEKTFLVRRDLGFDTSLEDPFEPIKRVRPKANELIPAGPTLSAILNREPKSTVGKLIKVVGGSKTHAPESQPASGNDVTNKGSGLPQIQKSGLSALGISGTVDGESQGTPPSQNDGLTVVTGEVNPAVSKIFGSQEPAPTGADNRVEVSGNLQLTDGPGTGNDVGNPPEDVVQDLLNIIDVLSEGDVIDNDVSPGAAPPTIRLDRGDVNTVPNNNGKSTSDESLPVLSTEALSSLRLQPVNREEPAVGPSGLKPTSNSVLRQSGVHEGLVVGSSGLTPTSNSVLRQPGVHEGLVVGSSGLTPTSNSVLRQPGDNRDLLVGPSGLTPFSNDARRRPRVGEGFVVGPSGVMSSSSGVVPSPSGLVPSPSGLMKSALAGVLRQPGAGKGLVVGPSGLVPSASGGVLRLPENSPESFALRGPSGGSEPRVLAMESSPSSRSEVTPVVINVPSRPRPSNANVFRGTPASGAAAGLQNPFAGAAGGRVPFGSQGPAGFAGAGGANAFPNPGASSPFGNTAASNPFARGSPNSPFAGSSPTGFGGSVPNSSPFLQGGASGGQSSPFGLQSPGNNPLAQQQLNGAGSSPFGGAQSSPFSGAQSSPLGGAQSSPFGGAQRSPFGGAQSSPLGGAQSSPFSGAQSSPFSGAQSSPFGGAQSSPFSGAQSSPFGGAQSSPFGGAQSSPFSGAQSSPFGGAQSSPFGVSGSNPSGAPAGSPFGATAGSPFGQTSGSPFAAGGAGSRPFAAAGGNFGNSALASVTGLSGTSGLPLSPFSAAAAGGASQFPSSPFTGVGAGGISHPFLAGGNGSIPAGFAGAGSPFGNTNPLGVPASPFGGSPLTANPFSSTNSLNPFSSGLNQLGASSGLNPFASAGSPFGNSQNPFASAGSFNPFSSAGGFNPFTSSGSNPFGRSAGGSPFGFPGATGGFGGSGQNTNLHQLLGLMSSSLLGRSQGSSRSSPFGRSPFGGGPFGGSPFGGVPFGGSPFGGGLFGGSPFASPFARGGFGGGIPAGLPGSSILSSREGK